MGCIKVVLENIRAVLKKIEKELSVDKRTFVEALNWCVTECPGKLGTKSLKTSKLLSEMRLFKLDKSFREGRESIQMEPQEDKRQVA